MPVVIAIDIDVEVPLTLEGPLASVFITTSSPTWSMVMVI